MSQSQRDLEHAEAALGPRERDDMCWRECPELAYEQRRTVDMRDHLMKLEEYHGLLIRNYALIVDQKNELIQENRYLRKKLGRCSSTIIRLLNQVRATKGQPPLDLS